MCNTSANGQNNTQEQCVSRTHMLVSKQMCASRVPPAAAKRGLPLPHPPTSAPGARVVRPVIEAGGAWVEGSQKNSRWALCGAALQRAQPPVAGVPPRRQEHACCVWCGHGGRGDDCNLQHCGVYRRQRLLDTRPGAGPFSSSLRMHSKHSARVSAYPYNKATTVHGCPCRRGAARHGRLFTANRHQR